VRLLGGGIFVLLVATSVARLVESWGSRQKLWWRVGFKFGIARLALPRTKGRKVVRKCGLLPSVGRVAAEAVAQPYSCFFLGFLLRPGSPWSSDLLFLMKK
jgi:hypothetical protein